MKLLTGKLTQKGIDTDIHLEPYYLEWMVDEVPVLKKREREI